MKKYFFFISLIPLLISCHSEEPVANKKNPKDTLIHKTSPKQSKDPSLFSEITCPECKHTKTEKLPTEVCQVSYTCENCKKVLHPDDGDCCVFCTYGTHKCPSKQNN